MYLESVGVEVIGEATTGVDAVKLARDLQPDMVIMDIHMPELTGIEATRRIFHESDEVRVLVLTAYDDPAYVHALLDAGADGFVLKTAAFSELYKALQDVAAGHTAFDTELIAKAAKHEESVSNINTVLTDREAEILTYAGYGLTNKHFGRQLFISDRTVQGHLKISITSLV
jgi:NarL family two-component system response regulator LiaR